MQITAQEAAYDYCKTGVFYDWLNDMDMSYMKAFWMWVDSYV
jgi:hypothetical protein